MCSNHLPIQTMTLQAKIGFLILVIAFLLSFSHYAIHRITVYPSILKLEQRFAEKDMERCVEALNRQQLHLNRILEDWASWDDSYEFIQNIDLDYVKSNLLKSTFIKNNLNLIYFIDNEGWVVWGRIYSTHFSKEIDLVDFPQRFPRFHPLLQHSTSRPSVTGAYITENGPMLIAARPIRSSDKTGVPRGTLLMGQFIGEDLLDNLISQTRVVLKIRPYHQINPQFQAITDQINRGITYPTAIIDDDTLHAYAAFPGINNQPTLLLQGELHRDITSQSRRSQHQSMFLMALACLVLFLILYIILDRTTFLPLQNLVLHASEIRHQKDLVSRLPGQERKDEIGSLIREMNHLLDLQYESTETLENTVDDRTLELSASNSLLQAEINHHQETQEQFSRLNDELEAIFATSRVGIMLLRGGRVLYKCNQRLAEIYGYESPKEMVQISMEKLHLSHDNFLKFGKEYYQTLQEGPQSQVEYEFCRKDGTKIWCLVSGMAMDTATPPDLDKGVTWVVDDITKRKEEELKLAELAKMQGMFATIGGVCHELGQPVQIISAHTQILKRQHHPNPHQLMNRVRSIYEQTERMGDILKNLQSITRFETTDYVAGMQILDINKSSEDNEVSSPDEPA